MTVDPRLFTELGIVTRIDDSNVQELSSVDDPATDIEFAMFKAIEKAPGLADVEACLRDGITTPTECQSLSEGYGNLLRADVRQDASKGETMEKIEALVDGPPPVEGEVAPAAGPEPIEIPATPIDWSLSKCIDAGVKLGLSEDQAGQACMVVREQYGAAGEDGKLLVPDGVKPEALLGAAAADLGFATLGGKAAPAKRQPPDPKAYPGIGTYWLEKVNRFLGRKTSSSPGEELGRYLKGLAAQNKALEGKLEELMIEQEKSKEDLRLAIRMGDRAHRRVTELLAAAMNVKLPDETEELEGEPTASQTASGTSAPEAPHPLTVDGKRAVKCDAPGQTAPIDASPAVAPEVKADPVAPTDSERIARLEALVEQLVSGGAAGGDLGMEPELDEMEQIDEEALIAETLAAAGATVPGKRSSAVTPLAARLAQVKANGVSGLPPGYSRGFTGMVIADADRDIAHRTRGLSSLNVKR